MPCTCGTHEAITVNVNVTTPEGYTPADVGRLVAERIRAALLARKDAPLEKR